MHHSQNYSTLTNVLPEDLLQELRNLGDLESDLAYRYGHLANQVYDFVVAHDIQMTRLETCGYVSWLAGGVRAPTTILEYCYLVENVPEHLRTRYPQFNMSLFKYASTQDDPEQVLDQADRMMADKGYPPTVSELSGVKVEAQAGQLDQVESNESMLSETIANLRDLVDGFRLSNPLAAGLMAQALILLEQAIKSIRREQAECIPVYDEPLML